MKILMAIAGTLLMASSAAVAATIPTCATNTLASYEALNATGGCQIDNLLFDNFSDMESSASTTQLNASEITVTPDFTLLNEGLQFGASWDVSTPASLDSAISF